MMRKIFYLNCITAVYHIRAIFCILLQHDQAYLFKGYVSRISDVMHLREA